MRRLVPLALNGDAFVEALQRTWDDGDAVLPIDTRLPRSAAEHLLATMRVDEPVDDGDALVVATSGSTGDAKGVVLTHDAVRASAIATSERIGVDAAHDRWLACLPLAHVGGLSVVTRALATGTALTVHERFDADAVMRSGASLVSLVGTTLRRVDPTVFRVIVLGGSTPPADLPTNVVTTYGMTETGSGVVYDGLPLDGVDVKIADGEILVRGPMLFRTYRDGDDPKDVDGWFATGDVGEIDAGGRLTVYGRRGDMIISGGENVWPEPIEAIIREHPDVIDVAVVGRADPEWGQRVVALVVADIPPSLDELRARVKERLGPWAAPREVELVEAIPRTALGKVRRAAL